MYRSPCLLYLLRFTVLCLLLTVIDANCIWYGIGGYAESQPRYNAYDGPGKPLNNPDSYAVLSKLCPSQALGPDSPLCCDSKQLDFFHASAKIAYELLRRCPACWANFRMIICAMTCSPNQSEYLIPTVVNNLVEAVQYRLSESVANMFFDSCKDVQTNGGHAIDPICATTSCTPNLLLHGIGSQSPFPVNFEIHNETDAKGVYDEPFFVCNKTVPRRVSDPGGQACSCMDCESSCSDPPKPPQPAPIPSVFGLDAWWVGAFFAFAAFVLIFAAFEIWTRIYHRRSENVEHVEWPRSTSESKDNAPVPSYQTTQESAPRYNCLVSLQAKLEHSLKRGFTSLGRAIARHPILTLLISILLSAVLSAGLVRFSVTTNPVELWSGPTSRSRLEKNYFDHNFAPFYRTEQLIIRPVNQSLFVHNNLYPVSGTLEFGPALRKEFLDEVLLFQNELRDFVYYSSELGENVTLRDICFQPLSPDIQECAITSPLEYFQSDPEVFNYTSSDFPGIIDSDYIDHLIFCTRAPVSIGGSYPNQSVSCLGASGMPIQPHVALGGFNGTDYANATSVVITFVVNNDPDPRSKVVRKAEMWETEYLRRVRNWARAHNDLATVSYQAERSVEDEINRQSEADVLTVTISYIVMFVYVSIFLASYRSCRTLFVDMRITLGLGGVLIVIVSVVASVGFWSYTGTPATLIIIEVIPFLVLAVGVDNIFILVHDFEVDDQDADQILQHEAQRLSSLLRQEGRTSAELPQSEMSTAIKGLVAARMARTLGRVGPSLLLSSAAESVAFFCGSLTSMPAVKMFALYAGVALVINFLLQIFAFVPLLTLDARRRSANRFDVCCCLGLREPNDTGYIASEEPANRVRNPADSLSLNSNAMSDVQLSSRSLPDDPKNDSNSVPWLHRLIENCLTPFVLSGWVRPIVVVLSLAWACFAIAIIPNGLHLGLDQRLSMPADSYMIDYFSALASDLRVGPPLYLVVTEGHLYNESDGQNQVCGGPGCLPSSLTGLISDSSKLSSYTRIAQPASSWIDDYFDWIDPDGSPYCCRVYPNTKTLCPDTEPVGSCETCPVVLENSRPIPEDFVYYLPRFLDQNPSMNCPKGGRAPYHVAVQLTSNSSVGATYFMTYHSVLSQPDDFLDALRQARHLTDRLNDLWQPTNPYRGDSHIPPRNHIFAYSVFYVFYEQYLTIVNEAVLQLGVCTLAIAAVTFVLLGLNLVATLMVLFGVVYIMLSLLAMMVLWQIDLNALSLVNLVVTLGIAVEFCAHIVRSFTVSIQPTRIARAKAALSEMGSSILRGITLTKLGGIVVLAFSKSQLFQVFYFRMYLGIIVFGALTGLIILPVLLSYAGPKLNKALAQKHWDRMRDRDLLENLPRPAH